MYGALFIDEAKPGKFQELVDFMTWDAEICRDKEPGTLRFEFYQHPDNENAIYVYEAYVDEEAFQAHKKNNEAFLHWHAAGFSEKLLVKRTILFAGDALFSPTD
jgi:quinol monooxygenase YgiN